MTEPTSLPAVPKALDFTSPEAVHERTLFRVDGEDYWATKPKGGILLRIAVDAANNTSELDEALMIDQFIEVCLEPETAARIRDRLEDPEDGFDVDTLGQIVQALQGAWGRRPTGRSSASRPPRRRSGRTSTGGPRAAG